MSETIDKLVNELIKNSQEALVCAIELHNKPRISYRYETVTILVINAWELLLKAYIVKNIGKDKIFEKDGEHTIGIISSIDEVTSLLGKEFDSIGKNLKTIIEYRNKVIHFNNINIDSLLFGILSKCIDKYIMFLQKNFIFEESFLKDSYVLPLVFSIQKSPLEIIESIKNDPKENMKLKEFITNLIQRIQNCDVSDGILYDIDVNLQSVKKIDNSDIIVAIDGRSPISVKTTKTVKLSKDTDAQKVTLTDEEIFALFPYTSSSLTKEASKRYYFVQNSDQHRRIKQEIEAAPEACYYRANHPQKKSGQDKFFSEKAFIIYEKHCRLIRNTPS